MVNQDYYIIERGGSSNYPLLEWEQKSGVFRKGKPVTVAEPIKLRLGAPVPDNPEMVDYHSLPKPVIGKRIKNILEPMNIYGSQLIPARIPVDDKVYNYWLLHVFNRIECMDRDKSISTYSNLGDASDIKSLVLDEIILEDIPLENRLIFVLRESTSTYLFHHSVKDDIMALEPPPEGIQFFRVDQWGSMAVFG